MEKLRQRGIEEHVPLDYQTQLKLAYLDGNICLWGLLEQKATPSFNTFCLLLLLIKLFYTYLSPHYATSFLHSL